MDEADQIIALVNGACVRWLPPPLEPGEREAIRLPLARVLFKYGGELPPEWALAGACVAIFGGRVASLLEAREARRGPPAIPLAVRERRDPPVPVPAPAS